MENLNSPTAFLPSAADPIVIVPSGTGNVYGSWVEIAASAPADLFIAGIVMKYPSPPSFAQPMDVQIGKGGAGSEVALATWGDYARPFSGISPYPRLGQMLAGIPISGISSGDRIAARMRLGNTDTPNFELALMCLPNPITGTLETTAQPLLATTTISYSTSGTPWANSSWSEVTAATSAAWVINHIVCGLSALAVEVEIDIGTGGAGSEAVVYTFRTRRELGDYPALENLPILFDNIANGARVAVRARASIASRNLEIRLGYYEKPL